MKFVDEVTIETVAGDGGAGIVAFRRERCIPRGGPNGGDGGAGGSVILCASEGINTLVDYRYQRVFLARSGGRGKGAEQHGADSPNINLRVPVGTKIWDEDTGELVVDLLQEGQTCLVARGGFGGLGNTRFKSSQNRTPRQSTPGKAGQRRRLRLELNCLADVGLLGLPNAGKSTFIACISNARPKIAAYPFTTLYPNLGVVRVAQDQSFVVADIPGLLPGAAEGVGLGHQFLRHLSRTSLLLHLVDMSAFSDSGEALGWLDPIAGIRAVVHELQRYSPELARKPRWLALNKLDTLAPQTFAEQAKDLVHQLREDAIPVERIFAISGLTGAGCQSLCQAIYHHLQYQRQSIAETPAAAQEHL